MSDELTGTSIATEQRVQHVFDSDQFLIAATNDTEYTNNRVDFKHLSDVISDRLMSLFNINTMAYHSENEYAKVDHTHSNYNKVQLTTNLPSESVPLSECTLVASVTINGVTQNIYVKKRKPSKNRRTHTLGEIKMTASRIACKQYTAADFDGWVEANGQTFDATKFPEETVKYFNGLRSSDTCTATTFSVPDFTNNFISMNNTPYVAVKNQQQPTKEVIVNHHHNVEKIQFKTDQTNGQLKYTRVSKKGSSSSVCHAAAKRDASFTKEVALKCSEFTTASTITTGQNGTTTASTAPAFNYIRMLVYIGLPKQQG